MKCLVRKSLLKKKICRWILLVMAICAAMMFSGCKAENVRNETATETSVQGAASETAVEQKTKEVNSEATDEQTRQDENKEDAAVAETKESAGKSDTSAAETEEYDSKDDTPVVDKNGYYYDVENVVLYLNAYGKLPDNYITKKEAQALGWEGGSVEAVAPDMAIGGDKFGNYEGKLPEVSGRQYYECDIDTHGYKNRGSRRLIFSNDGVYYYTGDHYENFEEVFVTDGGKVVR